MMNDQSMLGQMPPEQVPGMAQPEMPIDAQPPMGDPSGQAPAPQGDTEADHLDFALSQANLAKKWRDKEDDEGNNILEKMGAEIVQGYMDDEQSRSDWMEQNEEWLKLALLLRENKTFPWPKASNVKYPLVATAAMQFSARAYPALVPNDGNIVKAKVVRKDKQGLFQQKAIRVALHMSYQIMCKMPNWEEDMDKLLMTMAISGICFKETFHSGIANAHVSQLVYPEDLCVNYHAKSLEKAYRKTRILRFNANEVKAKVQNSEEFLDVELGNPEYNESSEPKKPLVTKDDPSQVDKSTPYTFLACHTFWDLDGDGYEEPYIITVHKESKQVVKIVARWDSDGVTRGEKDSIIHIKPVEYFTAFPFIPNPDGSIYALGFGTLLGPLNESSNTLINLLIDGGVLNTLSGGFIGKNLRIKMGQMQIRPGQWQVVNASGEDMQKSFYPIPTKEPSDTLFQLLQMLITSGNQLASIAEIFVGKMPGQNTPATTTQETIQQGMAVFTAIYKRVYRSLAQEFKKVFRLNRITPGIIDEEMYYSGEQLQESDYDGTEDYIIPGADPTGDSSTVRLMKLQQVGQLLQMGTIDPMAYTMRFLEAQDIPNYQELIAKPQPPQPDPEEKKIEAEMQMMQMEGEIKQQEAQMDMQLAQQKLELEKALAELKIQIEQAKLEFKQTESAMKLQGQQQEQEMNMVAQVNEQRFAEQKMQSDLKMTQAKNEQTLQQNDAIGEQKVKQAKAQAAAKPKPKAKSGAK